MVEVPKKLVAPNDGKYDVVAFIYDTATFPVYAISFVHSPTLRGTYISTNTIEDNVGYSWKIMAHELLHCLTYKIMSENNVVIPNVLDHPIINGKVMSYYKNDDPYATDGNFAMAWKELRPYLRRWKYFTQQEVEGLKPELVDLLDKARGIAGIPFKINSGYRTGTHNAEVGGTEDSSHTKGLAVDLRARNSNEHFLITKALLEVGFKRISKRYGTHVHCDLDSTKPQNVLF
jgi:hypothetical protein